MEENIPTRMALNTPEDLFKKLKWEEARLEESWGVYESFNFVVTAWHLYHDWISIKGGATAAQIYRKTQLPSGAAKLIRATCDLANGAKHWKMTHPENLKKQVVTEIEGPEIGDWLAVFDDKPMMYITIPPYVRLSMAELSALVVAYIQWILEGDNQPFPPHLTQNLEALRALQDNTSA
jgi:hypothetical protein